MLNGRTDAITAGGKTLLRLLVCGSPDGGDDALIGRLAGTGNVIRREQAEERQECIFGSVARRAFAAAGRNFTVAAGGGDMLALAAAASGADLAVLLVDARGGPRAQTRRQLLTCSVFGVRHLVLAVDGLDRVNFDETAFERIAGDYLGFAGDLGFAALTAIPISTRDGDNIAARSARTPWYSGPSLLEHLEAAAATAAPADQPPPATPAEFADQFAAHLVWLRAAALVPGRSYWLQIGGRKVSATITALKHRVDIDSGAHIATRTLDRNEIGYCNIATGTPVAFDPYAKSHETGSFILIDRQTQETAAAGVIDFALRRATNVHWHSSTISPGQRAELKGHHPAVLWLTGLSGAGKSTIANHLEAELLALGCHTMLLDGDNVRHRLNRDLGFTDTDRVENIRRIAEVARLMGDAGLIVICAFISPFRADRQMAREAAAPHPFLEIYIDTPIEECIRRDPKGLYAKAEAGQIPNFTGIDSPYEPPVSPEVRLTTLDRDADILAAQLVDELRRRAILT
jgi:adenylyl-sulfate kinase